MSTSPEVGPGQANPTRTKLSNVRVFDGTAFGTPQTIYIEKGIIASTISDEGQDLQTVDGNNGYLLPGLLDAHIHLDSLDQLDQLSQWGITTGLDMALFPPSKHQSFRSSQSTTSFFSAGTPATAPGSLHSRMPGMPEVSLLSSASEAEKFVADRVAEGSDYIKLIADVPGPDQATLNALVTAAHAHEKLAIAHAARFVAFDMAQKAGVDVVTHVPIDRALEDASGLEMVEAKRVAVPTLIMMKGTAGFLAVRGMKADYAHAKESVGVLHRAGVKILAGTDANASPGSPSPVKHGESLHTELELLVEAGLSNVEALRAATVLPAEVFGLADRGRIEPGLRADLVLLSENPFIDIRATRSIRKVWCAGIEVDL